LNYPVSIITPCYNCENYISFTIESVVQQTYSEWELIIVNDGSEDKSINLIKSYSEKDPRIKLIELENNMGPAYARNMGIRMASGRFIAFLDSDDLWDKKKLEKQISFMINNDISFSFTSYQKINYNGDLVGKPIKAPPVINYNDLLKSCPIGCLTVIYDQGKIGKHYMPDFLKAQDYALWLKILKTGVEANGIEENLAYYRIRKSSISRNKLYKAYFQWKIYRKQEIISIIKSMYLMFFYTFYGFKKMIE
jgi:glycosyltransferase involved in cell wall biosynthesis